MWKINIESVVILFICVALRFLCKFSHFACSLKPAVGWSVQTAVQQTSNSLDTYTEISLHGGVFVIT